MKRVSHMMRQYELVERVLAYDPKADEALLNRAYVYAMQAHSKQKRASGDPYFSHPLEVAGHSIFDCRSILNSGIQIIVSKLLF